MKAIIAGVVALAATGASAQGYHSVRGYERSDGTYVQPHEQTNPNSTRTDNWSSQGNVNPFTGQAGTRDPYTSSSSYGGTSESRGRQNSGNPW